MDDSDKFHYLQNSLVKGARAYDVVDSYPKTKINYQKAVKILKDRYGNTRILKQLYVHKLLKMVIKNAKPTEKINVA